MKRSLTFVLGLAALAFISACDNRDAKLTESEMPEVILEPAADIVLRNGKILTVDDEFSIATEIAIRDDRIIAVGPKGIVNHYLDEDTEIIDLAGRTVIPGLIDNHIHFIRAGQKWNLQARIDGVASRQEALDIISQKASSMEPGEWLMVQGGWWPGQFADQPGDFTLEELDAASPNNPLFLQLIYFNVYANSLALEAVGVDPALGAKHGGPVLISTQPPYGSLNEQMPDVSKEQIKQNVRDVVKTFNAGGLTSVYDVGRPPEGDISLLEEMLQEDEGLNLRVWHTLKYEAYDEEDGDAAIELIKSRQPENGDYIGLLGLGEHVYLPFFDLPGFDQVYPDEIVNEFGRISRAAAEQGFRVNEHTMMDQTINSALDEWEKINEDIPLAPLRWSLEHLFNPTDETLIRMRDLGITAAVHGVAQTLPMKWQPPMKRMQELGVVWGLGSDGTIVTPWQPFLTLGWAVTGKSFNGQTLFTETVSREEALIAHTRTNAYLLFKDDDIGSLEVGKLADLVVLDSDYMTVPEDEIFDISALMTMVGGRIVYDDLNGDEPVPAIGRPPGPGLGAVQGPVQGEPGQPGAGPRGGGPGAGGPPPQQTTVDIDPDSIEVYKTDEGVELSAHIFNPEGHGANDARAALIFLHGGGLRRGNPTQGYEFAEHFNPDGVVVISPQYRLLGNDADSLDEIVADAKSIVRWTRENAGRLGIDPDKIMVSGHSAGAYLAMTSGVIKGFDQPSENMAVSSVPDALILWSSATTRRDDPENSMVPEGYTMADFSAPEVLPDNLPPALFIHGDQDPVASPELAAAFEAKYRAAGNQSSYKNVPGADHFFREAEQRTQVVTFMKDFMVSLGYTD